MITAKFGNCSHCGDDRLLRRVLVVRGERWVCTPCRKTLWFDIATESDPGSGHRLVRKEDRS